MSYEIIIKERGFDPGEIGIDTAQNSGRVIYSQLVEENPLKAVIHAVNARRRKRTATAKKDD